jgi:AraC family transcriptional regulator
MSVQYKSIDPLASMTVDAEHQVSVATTQLVRFHLHEPGDNSRREEENFWLDMCLTPRPRNARACFVEHWAPHRFEQIGQMFLLPPRQTFRVLSDGGPSQASVLCHLRPEALSHLIDRDVDAAAFEWTGEKLKASLDISDNNLRMLMRRLADELRNPGFAAATLIELLVGQISIELMRYCTSKSERTSSGSLAPWRLRLIDQRLREVHAAPSLSELAKLCNMSVRQLTRAFRASRGCSIGDYVAECRISHAKRLLAAGQSVKAVAFTLGFGSPSSFSFAFRTATGLTPRAYQTDVCRSARAVTPLRLTPRERV